MHFFCSSDTYAFITQEVFDVSCSRAYSMLHYAETWEVAIIRDFAGGTL
jgi:hypothetical protein